MAWSLKAIVELCLAEWSPPWEGTRLLEKHLGDLQQPWMGVTLLISEQCALCVPGQGVSIGQGWREHREGQEAALGSVIPSACLLSSVLEPRAEKGGRTSPASWESLAGLHSLMNII